MVNKFEENLVLIKHDLDLHKKSKNDLMTVLVQERLDGSLKNYYNELNHTVSRLSNYNAIQVDRNLNEDNRYIRRFE